MKGHYEGLDECVILTAYCQYADARLLPRIRYQWRKGHPASSVQHRSYCLPEFGLPILQQMLGRVLPVGLLYKTLQLLVHAPRYGSIVCPWPPRLRQKAPGCPKIETCQFVV